MSDLELFTYDTCPYSQRVQITLHGKQLAFTKTLVDVRKTPPWFHDISPYGKVPLLRSGNHYIGESLIINEYLEEKFPDIKLLPESPHERAWARFWIQHCDAKFMSACNRLIADRKDADKQERNRATLDEALLRLESAIGVSNGPYWLGERLSLVDITYAPFFERYECYQALWGARWPQGCEKLGLWREAVAHHPAVATTAHDLEFHMQAYRRYDAAA
ncbi:MAG: glutathione S-transferase family protein [Steroidobacteraceae bacterium]